MDVGQQPCIMEAVRLGSSILISGLSVRFRLWSALAGHPSTMVTYKTTRHSEYIGERLKADRC